MNILLSAFLCEPFSGSEAGNGWNWAFELARRGNSVFVVTSPLGRNAIENFLATTAVPTLRIIFVDLPEVPNLFGQFRMLTQCIIWQWRALAAARRLIVDVNIDLVHHVTWASIHVGSQLWRLGKPFVFGPVGGGQVAEPGFQRYLRGGRMVEFVRSIIVQYFSGVLFFARSTVSHSAVVLVTNFETRELARRLGAGRIEFMLDVGISETVLVDPATRRRDTAGCLKILWVGRLLPRKAVLLALEAMSKIDPNISFLCTILGDGKQGQYLHQWIEQLKLRDRVRWFGQVPWNEVIAAYSKHDVFLFTSLRDSSGAQLIEAMAQGAAMVVLDHHGAKAVVPESAGIRVPITTPEDTVDGLARALERLAREPRTLAEMAENGIKFAAEHTWRRKVTRAEAVYHDVIGRV